jgi:hypothetical protein
MTGSFTTGSWEPGTAGSCQDHGLALPRRPCRRRQVSWSSPHAKCRRHTLGLADLREGSALAPRPHPLPRPFRRARARIQREGGERDGGGEGRGRREGGAGRERERGRERQRETGKGRERSEGCPACVCQHPSRTRTRTRTHTRARARAHTCTRATRSTSATPSCVTFAIRCTVLTGLGGGRRNPFLHLPTLAPATARSPFNGRSLLFFCGAASRMSYNSKSSTCGEAGAQKEKTENYKKKEKNLSSNLRRSGGGRAENPDVRVALWRKVVFVQAASQHHPHAFLHCLRDLRSSVSKVFLFNSAYSNNLVITFINIYTLSFDYLCASFACAHVHARMSRVLRHISRVYSMCRMSYVPRI